MDIEKILNILTLKPEILFLAVIILIAFVMVVLIFCLPLLYKHIDQLKIGNNEIKFRPFPPPQDTISLQALMDEIKSWKTTSYNEDNNLTNPLMQRVCWILYAWRSDLFSSAMNLSLLLTAMERPDVQAELGKDKDTIMQNLYTRLDYEIGKYFLLEDGIIKFAKCVGKVKEYKKKLENEKDTILMLEFHNRLPECYRKFDYQEFLKNKKI